MALISLGPHEITDKNPSKSLGGGKTTCAKKGQRQSWALKNTFGNTPGYTYTYIRARTRGRAPGQLAGLQVNQRDFCQTEPGRGGEGRGGEFRVYRIRLYRMADCAFSFLNR